MEVTFLGTGTSHGVPVIGCNCKTCTSDDPRNVRNRASVHIKINKTELLIDTPPEMRIQLLKYNLKEIDAVLLTHTHADHIMGFDDIRGINWYQKKPLPVYGNLFSINEVKRIFSYIFNLKHLGGGIPQVNLSVVEGDFYVNHQKITPLPIYHGKRNILGYRINDFAYLTDCSKITQKTYQLLDGIDVLVIDSLRYKSHPTHMSVDEAISEIGKIGAKKAYLTHLSHRLEHNELINKLPANIEPAYDGLKIQV